MKILGLVTARGGSKRLPGKNIRVLGSDPLIVWSIKAAQGIPEICEVMVSTDDAAIASVARAAGALVPWLRPESLATDEAGSAEVCLHALEWYERSKGAVDGLLLLQPTSPFRSRGTMRRGIALFQENHLRPVVAVSPAPSHPMWCFTISDGVLHPFIDATGLKMRSQDLPAAYVVNGSYYLITPADLREQGSFFRDGMVPLVTSDPAESLDIDTEWDWTVAEALLAISSKGVAETMSDGSPA